MTPLLDLPGVEGAAKTFGRQSWLPVRVRHWPYNTLDARRQRAVAARNSSGGGVHFVGFTCGRHFPLLECALESLLRVHSPDIRKIHLFIDDSDFLDASQTRYLERLSPLIAITRWPRFTGWGFDAVRLQFRTFAEVAKRVAPGDYVAKMDSDLVFISTWIVALALRSGADIVGDGRYIDFDYAQGGCFFLSRPLALRLEEYCLPGVMESMFPAAAHPPEEHVLREVARRERARVWLTRFMMFPDEFEPTLRRRGDFVARHASKFCVLHFLRDKETMPVIYRDVFASSLQPART
jgi:hypothetical protein